jgi:hypothetical protein
VRNIFFVFSISVAPLLWSQPSPAESNAATQDPQDELGKLKKNCFAHPLSCGEVLFTGDPIHIAAGSLAPQNGFGAGVAYVGHKDLKSGNWRNSWNADAVASSNGSWRAGLYAKFVYSHMTSPSSQFGLPPDPNVPTEVKESPVLDVYAQSMSLNKLTFFGLGPNTTTAMRSFYGMTETVTGVSGVKPFASRVHLGIYGEINGRFADIRSSPGQESPSIEVHYGPTTAPGLGRQTSFLQLGVGARMRPTFDDDLFHLNYDVSYKPYAALGTSHMSFQRFSADITHQMLLYHKRYHLLPPQTARAGNGPDDCRDPSAKPPGCPKVSTRDLEGSIGVRFYTALSMTPGGGTVPFYFQPTLGGSDIDGNSTLASFQDYRFRAPNVMLVREGFEHSIWKLPIGFALMADQGTVSMTRGGLGSSQWRHSFSAGLTLHAGGLPVLSLLYSWGGGEGTHTTAAVNSSLLGASARPSLY